MGKKKRKNKKEHNNIKFDSTPVSCSQCKYSRSYMKRIAPNHLVGHMMCKKCNNQIPMNNPLILIPKWCPCGYKNLFDLN